MTSWGYILQSLPWAIAGALVGFFMGRSTVAVQVIAEAVQEGADMPAEEIRIPWYRKITAMQVIGTVVVLLGIFTAVQGYVLNDETRRQGQETQRLGQCMIAYGNGFADALEARSNASQEAQNGLDDLLTKAVSATPTVEGRDVVRQALHDYLANRAAAKKTQAEHPFPDPPRDACKAR